MGRRVGPPAPQCERRPYPVEVPIGRSSTAPNGANCAAGAAPASSWETAAATARAVGPQFPRVPAADRQGNTPGADRGIRRTERKSRSQMQSAGTRRKRCYSMSGKTLRGGRQASPAADKKLDVICRAGKASLFTAASQRSGVRPSSSRLFSKSPASSAPTLLARETGEPPA